MMKRIAVALMLVLGTAGAAQAQTTASGDAVVTVDVYQGLSLTVMDASVDFGAANTGVAPAAIDPNTAGGSAAQFAASGQSGVPILVTYPATLALDNGSGATVDFTPDLVGADVTTARATAPAVASNSTVTLSTAGVYYFWLGGSLTAPGTLGNYSGDFTLTVAY